MEEKKVIILDFDGTVYSGSDIFDYVFDYVCEHRRQFLPNVDDKTYAEICEKFPEWLTVESGKQITSVIYKIKKAYPNFEITTADFWNIQNKYPYNIKLDNAHITNFADLERVAKKYHIYLVSNSSPMHLSNYLKKFNIDESIFSDIVSNHFVEEDPSKEHYYRDIMEKENVEPKNVFVFGDSDSGDLEPARHLGCNAFLSTDASKLCDLIEEKLK